MVRQAVPLQGHDNLALTNDAGIVLRRLRRLKSNAVAPEPLGAPLESFAAPACEAEAEGITPQQETPFGAVNGTSEAKPKPSWTLPDVTLSRVKDRAMGFVRQGSSKYFRHPVVNGSRRVKVGGHGLHRPATGGAATEPVFPDNTISTSKYSAWSFFPVNLFEQFRRLVNFYYLLNSILTYSLLTFLPKNLFEQFRRLANFYFLCIALLQLLIDSPVSPVTSALPLSFVVAVTMLKQGYEDWLRHKMDDEVNNKPARVVRYGVLMEVKTRNISVGDIVCVSDNEELPCDLVLLSSSDPHGECYIQTANLDGETNLKTKTSPAQTRKLRTPCELDTIRAEIDCENPHPDLYKFVGAMSFQPEGGGLRERIPLGPEQVLLRGSRLKNTHTAYGCAIYTGKDTKLARNLKITANKFSSVESSMNKYLFFFLLLLVVEVAIATMLSAIYNPTGLDNSTVRDTYSAVPEYHWYLDTDDDSFQTVNTILSFLILFNYVIPISLYVTIEVVKFWGTRFLEWDDELMYDGIRLKANTSDLNEELGQVEYLFSDKTGTLTENEMQFQHCSVAGRAYKEAEGRLEPHCPSRSPHQTRAAAAEAEPISDEMQQAELDGFLTALALCHTVQLSEPKSPEPPSREGSCSPRGPDGTAGNSAQGECGAHELPEYQASSPDEKALVEACSRFGVIFGGTEGDVCKITVRGRQRLYRRLFVLEFDADRKRMSVVVEDDRGRILLICKGADSAVLSQCVAGDLDRTADHVHYYAQLGLRTLVFAWRELSPAQLEQYSQELNRARSAMENREEAVKKASSLMESELEVLGATGVEDKLQEGVPETLETLRAAGVKIWVLTGDKIETAINIATSCGHLKRGTTLLQFVRNRVVSDATKLLLELDILTHMEQYNNFGLVLDGESLQVALQTSATRHQLLRVATRCQAVLCCRMSPMQKAEVVKLVKYSHERPITAAIGDGANDVSMIQEADVGFGLVGREGRQAARCSDFSMARFGFLRRVLLVHGHWYYVRLANLVQYCFYKNVAFITPQLFFTAYTLFSTTSLYDGFFLTFYNIFFVAAPPIAYGVLEKDLPAEVLSSRPEIYQRYSRNVLLSWGKFFRWTLLGLWHASIAFFMVWCSWREDPITVASGHMTGVFTFGTLICQIIVLVVNTKIVLMSRYMTWVFFFFLFGGLTMMSLTSVYCIVQSSFIANHSMKWVYEMMAVSIPLWLLQLVAVVVCLIPDVILEVARTHERGLANWAHRLRLLLGVPTSASSVLPAFSRDADGSVTSLPCASAVSGTV